MNRVLALIGGLVRREMGQDLLEYGLLGALIAVAVIAGIRSVGDVVNGVLWESIAQNL